MNVKLDPNETIIYECKPHWIVFVRPVILAIFWLLFFLVTKDAAYFLVLFALSVAWPIAKIKTNILVLTDKRVYGKSGIFGTSSLTAPFSQINTVNLTRSLIGRVLGYGTLQIHCITGVYKYKTLCNPEEMQNAIINKITK